MTNKNKWSFSGIRPYRTVMFFCMFVFLLLSGSLWSAENHARKVVRVPYQEFNKLMMVDEDNKPVSGYAFDYIETIGSYAGWDIEYIPCNGFSDCLNRLLAGEVDLFYDISYTEERAKEILFPEEPMGYQYYYLYISDKNTSITAEDYTSMNGKSIGITRGTMAADILKQWCKKKNVEFKIVEYDSIPEKEADLFAGKLDLDMEVSISSGRTVPTRTI